MPRSMSLGFHGVALLATLAFAAPSQALVYRGLVHTPIGATNLALSDTLLLVSGFGASGADGMSIGLPAACVNVAALFDSIRLGPGGDFTANFSSGATATAYATVVRLPSDSLKFVAGFDGVSDTSSIRLSAYLGPTLVRSMIVHPQAASAPNASMSADRNRTNIIPFIILGGVVLGILSDIREEHVQLPSDPPGIYSKEVHYTFVGYGLAHPATGHLPGDPTTITFDKLVVSPVRKYSGGMSLTLATLTGHNVQAFKIGQEFVTSASTATPGLGVSGLIIGNLLIVFAAIAVLIRRKRAGEANPAEGSG